LHPPKYTVAGEPLLKLATPDCPSMYWSKSVSAVHATLRAAAIRTVKTGAKGIGVVIAASPDSC
jgi:hypothetical protein